MDPRIEALKAAVAGLPQGLAEHVREVVAEASRLASRFPQVDREQVELAAWGHDIARALSSQELLTSARAFGLAVGPLEENVPILLHGPLAAEMLRRDYGIDDAQVLAAVRFHTTGRAGMSLLEKIIFVADKIEATKVAAAPALARVRKLAEGDLDGAILEYLNQMLALASKEGWPLHLQAVAARNELVLGRWA